MTKKSKTDDKKTKKPPEAIGVQIVAWIKTIVGAFLFVMVINGLLVASFVVPTPSMENEVMTGDFLFVNKFLYGPTTPQVIPFFDIPLPYYKFPGPSDPERNDVIVFIYPGDRDEVEPSEFQYFLKRCVAVAGDELEIRNNILYINGEEQEKPEHSKYVEYYRDPHATFPKGKNYTIDNYGPLTIPKEGQEILLAEHNFHEWETFIKREGHSCKMFNGKIKIDNEEVNSYTVERDYCFGMGDNRNNSSDSRMWGFIPYENVVGTPMIVYWSWDTGKPMSSFGEKFASVKWSRIFNIIN